jgi:hypothetical protein
MVKNQTLPKSQAGSGTGTVREQAVIIDVGERSFDVLIQRFGLEKRCFTEDMTKASETGGSDAEGGSRSTPAMAISAVVAEDKSDAKTVVGGPEPGKVSRKMLRVQWAGQKEVQTYRLFDTIWVELSTRMQAPIDLVVRAVPPPPAAAAAASTASADQKS